MIPSQDLSPASPLRRPILLELLLCLAVALSPAAVRADDPGTLAPDSRPAEGSASETVAARASEPEDSEGSRTEAEVDEKPTEEIRDEIVVVATRSEKPLQAVPANVSVVDFEQLTRDGFYAGADELRGQPGIFFRRSEGDNDAFLFVNFRGVTGNHGNDTFLALVDGIPFVSGDEEVLMSEIPYGAVESAEIVRGPVSALYGRGGIAGAIAYTLRSPSSDRTELRTAFGSDAYWNATLNLGRRFGNYDVFLSVDGLGADGWREQNQNRRLGALGRLQFAPDDSTLISAYLHHHDRRYETGSVIPTLPDGTLVDVAGGREAFFGSRDLDVDSESQMAALRFSRVLSGDRLIEATAHHRQRQTDNAIDFYDFFGFDPAREILTVNGFDSDVDERATFLEATYRFDAGATQNLIGASYERTDLQETDLWTGQFGFTFECGFAFYAVEINYATGQVVNRDHPCFVERQHNLTGDTENTFQAAFAQTELDLGDRWIVTLGARWDEFERQTALLTGPDRTAQPSVVDTEDHLSPKVAVVYSASPQRTFYLNFGEGFASNFGPVWQWDPSRYLRDTRPTILRNYEVGAKGSLRNGRLSYTLALFAIEQQDRLVFVSNPAAAVDFTAPSTIATTGQRFESRGLEATVAYRFGNASRIEARYSHVDAEWDELVLSTFSGPLDLSGTTPTGVPEDIFYLEWTQRLGDRADTQLSWESYGDYPITQDNAFTGGGYDLLNLGVAYRPPFAAIESVHLAATNLLDEQYYFFFGGSRTAVTNAVPGVPRQLRLSLSWSF